MHLENLVNVFDKIFDRFTNKFMRVRNLAVEIRKVDGIFKDVCDKPADYSTLFTIILKGTELMHEYSAYRS